MTVSIELFANPMYYEHFKLFASLNDNIQDVGAKMEKYAPLINQANFRFRKAYTQNKILALFQFYSGIDKYTKLVRPFKIGAMLHLTTLFF